MVDIAAGSRVLDIGCGTGDAVALLSGKFGYLCSGVDKSEELIRAGLKKYPTLDLRVGEAHSLGFFESGRFQAVTMECFLSVSGAPDAALREAARVTALGGCLLIADLCDRKEAARLREKPAALSPRDGRSCPDFVVYDGRVSVEDLISRLQNAGFVLVSFEDKTRDLDSFAIEKIWEFGSLEAYYADVVPEDSKRCDFFPRAARKSCAAEPSRPPGYFVSVFRKSQ
jgi:SAM-dependent methyltransferase